LQEVIAKRKPELQSLKLEPSLIEELCDIVMDEFCETGLKDDDEPNNRGLKLEDLVDELRRFSREQ